MKPIFFTLFPKLNIEMISMRHRTLKIYRVYTSFAIKRNETVLDTVIIFFSYDKQHQYKYQLKYNNVHITLVRKRVKMSQNLTRVHQRLMSL